MYTDGVLLFGRRYDKDVWTRAYAVKEAECVEERARVCVITYYTLKGKKKRMIYFLCWDAPLSFFAFDLSIRASWTRQLLFLGGLGQFMLIKPPNFYAPTAALTYQSIESFERRSTGLPAGAHRSVSRRRTTAARTFNGHRIIWAPQRSLHMSAATQAWGPRRPGCRF